MTPIDPSTAISGATGLDTGLSRLDTKTNLKKAGQQFEAVFTGMMLKAMHATKLADPLFDSKAIDTFSEMQDAQIAKSMSEHTPLGIGKALTDFLGKSKGNVNDAASEAVK